MSKRPELSSPQPVDDYSSGEETSYETAFEDIQDDSPDASLKSDTSGDLSREESFEVSEDSSPKSGTSGDISHEESFEVSDDSSPKSDTSGDLSREESFEVSEDSSPKSDTSGDLSCEESFKVSEDSSPKSDTSGDLSREESFEVSEDSSPKSGTSGDLSREESFEVSEDSFYCEDCKQVCKARVDAKTQTSNCRFCRIFVGKQERDAQTQTSNCKFCRFIWRIQSSAVCSETGGISYKDDTDYSDTSSAISSPATVTPPVRESDIAIGSDDLSSTIAEHLPQASSGTPTISKDKDSSRKEFLVSETVLNEHKTMSIATIRHSPEKSAEGGRTFVNRNIDSVARIIVEESVDAARTDKQQQQADKIYHDASSEDIAWRRAPGNDSTTAHGESDSSELSIVKSSNSLVEQQSQIAAESSCMSLASATSVTIAKRNSCRMPDGIDPTLVDHAIWTMENLHEMWSQGRLCDITLVTSSGKRFAAHKVILSLHSGFFQELILNSGSHSNLKIALSDSIRDDTIASILRFMYTSLVQINKDTISSLLHAFVQLSIHRLTRLCMSFIDRVTIENCFSVLAIAEKNGLKDHISGTKNFIYEHFKKVTTTEAFLNAPIERVREILMEDTLNVNSEVDVFLAAKRWSRRNQDPDMKNVAAAMKTIRFELFSAEELASHVESVDWLMVVPAVRVRVLEAYRYLSLAESEEKDLRPPSPRRRTSMQKASNVLKKAKKSQQSKHNVATAASRVGVRAAQKDHTRSVSCEYRSGHDSSSDAKFRRDIGTDPKSRHDISTSVSGTFFGAESREITREMNAGVNMQHSSVKAKKGAESRETAHETDASVTTRHESVKTKKCASKSLRKKRATNNSRLEDARKTSDDSIVTEALHDSPHLRDAMSKSVQCHSAHSKSKSRKTSTPKSSHQAHSQAKHTSAKSFAETLFIIKKPGSDYRITSGNPNAMQRGPQAWPKHTGTHIVPVDAEDDVSDIIVVSGGVSTKGDVDRPGKVIELYDPQRDQWRKSIGAPVARNHHVVCFLQDSLYLIGGSDPHSDGSEFIKPVKTVYRYDIRSQKWTEASPMSCARIFHQAAALLGQLYVVGGQDQRGRLLNSVETYAPVSDTWYHVAPISTPRYAVSMATYGQRLWVAGGYSQKTGSEMSDTVECFNPYTEEWAIVTSLRYPRCHANLLVTRGRLYLVGGYVVGQHGGVDMISTIDGYDETEDRWREVTRMEHGRHDGKTVAWNDRIYIFGARSDDEHERPLPRVDYFDTSENRWRRQATNLTGARLDIPAA